MTGFAGATGAMMGHGPAEMTGMGVGMGDFRKQASDSSTGTTDQGTDSTTAPADLGTGDKGGPMRSFLQQGSSENGDNPGAEWPMFKRNLEDGMKTDVLFSRGTADNERGGGGSGEFGGAGSGADIPMMTSQGGNAGGNGSGGMTDPSTGNTQLDTDLKKLRNDEQAIQDKSEVTPVLMASVRKDLEAIDAAKTGDGDATALKTLQSDEQSIFAGKAMPTDAQQAQLQADHDAVLLSQEVSQTLIDQLAADQLAVKTASHFTADDQATLDADHAAIEADRAASASTTQGDPGSTPDTSATPAVAATTTAPDATDATPATPTPVPTPPVAPDAPSTPAPVATATTMPVAPPTNLDPSMMTQVTSTANPTGTHQPMAGGHHGHSANAGHHFSGGGHQQEAQHAMNFGGRARRSFRR